MKNNSQMQIVLLLIIAAVLSLVIFATHQKKSDAKKESRSIATNYHYEFVQISKNLCIGNGGRIGHESIPFVVDCERIPPELLKKIEK